MTQLYRPEVPLATDASYRVVCTTARPALLLPGHDVAWETAQHITWGPDEAKTTFAALWNESGLAVRFDVCDEHPWHTMTRRDDTIWEEEVVEIFIDPTGTGRHYLEIEINPINVVTDLLIKETSPVLVNELAWNWEGLQSTVVPGTSAGMKPGSWVALAWLPWSRLLGTPDVAGCVPPKSGARWKFNVFRIKRPGGPSAPKHGAIFAAWSAPEGKSFHAPAFFRDFVFE